MDRHFESNSAARAAAAAATRQRFAQVGEQWLTEATVTVCEPRSSSDNGFSVLCRWVRVPFPARTNSQLYVLAEQIARVLYAHGTRKRWDYLEAYERHHFAHQLLRFSRITVPRSSTSRAKREVQKLIDDVLDHTGGKVDGQIAEWAGGLVPRGRLSAKSHYDQIQGHVVGEASRLAGVVHR